MGFYRNKQFDPLPLEVAGPPGKRWTPLDPWKSIVFSVIKLLCGNFSQKAPSAYKWFIIIKLA